ncbi:MAG: D-alanine--D-alanine ligase [Alphaproteobacteria bacterium]|nr:D-alanine--D-alanine ligase [Alphaproteobacteria bacterium]
MSKKVLVLMGGFSHERNVSLVSGKGVAEALRQKKFNVVEHDLQDGWAFLDVLKKEKPDVVFNALHGNWGEDGEIQGFLDVLQIPYTHSGMKASLLGMDKNITKDFAKSCGIKIAPSEKMKVKDFFSKGTSIDIPYVLKPVSDGSSVGVFIIMNENDLKQVYYDDENIEIMVEKYISGKELTISCINGKSFVVTEIKPKVEFYDYNAKYTNGITEHVLPAEIPDNVAEECKQWAERLHKKLGCNMVSRIDVRYNEKDGPVFLEINTHPGMTPLSLVPEQAKYAGISYADLCEMLVDAATCRSLRVDNA